VIFASLPAEGSEVVLRAAWDASAAPRYLDVTVDGHAATRLSLGGGGAYRDLAIKVPPAPGRPSISEIGLQFDTPDPVPFAFKLDRLAFR
jgi:hypothetical protein